MGKFDCRGILRTMSAYISGELGKRVCADIEAHLTTCRKCRFHVDAVKFTINLYDDWRADDMPDDAVIRLRDRLRDETGCFGCPPEEGGGKDKTAGKRTAPKTSRKKAVRKKTAGKKTSRKKTSAGKAVRRKTARGRSSARRKKT